MKINKIHTAFIVVLMLTLCSVGILHFYNKNKQYTFVTQPLSHSIILTDSDPTFELIVYSYRSKSMYFEKKAIQSISIKSLQTQDELKLNLDSIMLLENKTLIDKKHYYAYRMKLSTNLVDNSVFQPLNYPNASLQIQYVNGEELMLPIGEATLLRIEKLGVVNQVSSDIKITNLRGLVNVINDLSTLVGIEMNITTNLSSDIVIRQIGLLTEEVKINYDYVIFDEGLSSFTSPATEVFGETYHIFRVGEKELFEHHIVNSETRLILPLSYIGETNFLNEVGIYIEYVQNGVTKYYVFGTFCFFETTPNTSNWIKYQYERN